MIIDAAANASVAHAAAAASAANQVDITFDDHRLNRLHGLTSHRNHHNRQ